MIEFPKYAQIKDKYCICYFGQSKEYLLQLNLLKLLIENKYPNLLFYIGCRDEFSDLLPKSDFVLKFSELRNRRLDFGHIREISFDGKNHPIWQFIEESGLENCVVCNQNQEEKLHVV